MGKCLLLQKNFMKQIFDVDLLPEAVNFLETIDEKAREKIYYNIKKILWIIHSKPFLSIR